MVSLTMNKSTAEQTTDTLSELVDIAMISIQAGFTRTKINRNDHV
jgi:hypothetical protein